MTKSTPAPRRSGRPFAQGSETLSRQIQEKAFELYQRRGGAHGDDQADWFEAERIVLQNQKQAMIGAARPAASRGNGQGSRPAASRRKTGRRAGV